MTFNTIAVIGAGTMGAGIAQVAAAAGHRVKLLDVRAGAAQSAIDQIGKALASLVDKGRLSAEDRSATLGRLSPAAAVSDLGDAQLVVEVIVEDLEAKRRLLSELEAVVSDAAVLASNTSSISITAIAKGLKRPGRVVGMHFFNPVPLMKLVEVVSGADSSPDVAQSVFDLAGRWGKTAVHAKSTPGFIVNRIARPYYAETLTLLQDQAATPAAIDAAARSAGFRLGPCELMDLIGHDVNFAVTQSVFDANFGDRRYVPSLVQQAMVDGGRLGRKSGRGFYDGVPSAEAAPVPATSLPAPLTLHGRGPVVDALSRWIGERGLPFAQVASPDWIGFEVAGVELHVSDGRTAIQRAAERGHGQTAVIDLPVISERLQSLAIAFASSANDESRKICIDTLQACGWHAREFRDVPGLWAARTIAMLVNEGADAVYQGVCDEPSADLSMKLGTAWPAGPFEWLAAFGVEHIVAVLDHLHAATRSERYRVSPLLQQRWWAAKLNA
jgi:3-hydroxybutyryl-CoA dehydrogenase